MEAARLQEMTGPALTIREQDGAGRLRLEVMRCPPPASARNARTLSYAYVLIPVEGESSPISITGVSPGGWRFVRTVVAGDSTERLFSDFSHELTRAEQALVVREGGGDTSVSVRLEFAEGYLDITAELEPGAAPHRESTALLGSGPGYVSAYFGEEAFERCAASATVRSAGATPLPPLPARPAVAVFDRELASHRVYWRVPVGG